MSAKPIRSATIAPAPDLARAFDSAVREGFRIAGSAGLAFDLHVSSSASVTGTVALDQIAYPFWIIARFEGLGLEGQICFGDREFFVQTEVAPLALDTLPPDGYAFWEWATAMDEPSAELSNTDWCIQPPRVQSVVREQIAWLERHALRIANPTPSVIDRLAEARLHRRTAWHSEERLRERHGKVRMARAGLRLNEYSRVVDLLTPYEAELSPAELKLLAIARKGLDLESQGR